MSPVERYRGGRLTSRRSYVPAMSVGASIVMWTALMIYGPGIGIGLGGAAAPSVGVDTAVTAAVAAPNKPTVSAVAFAPTGDSLRVVGSAFVGSGADTQDSTQVQVDTAGAGAWSGAKFSSSLGAVLTDTAIALDSGSVVKSRIRYKGASGGWSTWSDSTLTTMVGPGALTVHFFSDWRNTTGTSAAAYLDGSKWTSKFGSTALAVVAVADSSLDFPTTNMLLVPNDWGGVRLDNALPTVAVGDSVFVRFYKRSFGTGDTGHGDYWDNSNASPNWGPAIAGFEQEYSGTVGATYTENCSSHGTSPVHQISGVNNRYFGNTLTGGVSYRYEMRVKRTGTLTYTLGCRVYNAAGTLLHDSDGTNEFPANNTPTAYLKDQVFTANSAAHFVTLEGFLVGSEGPNGSNEPVKYLAGLAICNNWCGAYPISGVEN